MISPFYQTNLFDERQPIFDQVRLIKRIYDQ
jgi:hypothetical protein